MVATHIQIWGHGDAEKASCQRLRKDRRQTTSYRSWTGVAVPPTFCASLPRVPCATNSRYFVPFCTVCVPEQKFVFVAAQLYTYSITVERFGAATYWPPETSWVSVPKRLASATIIRVQPPRLLRADRCVPPLLVERAASIYCVSPECAAASITCVPPFYSQRRNHIPTYLQQRTRLFICLFCNAVILLICNLYYFILGPPFIII